MQLHVHNAKAEGEIKGKETLGSMRPASTAEHSAVQCLCLPSRLFVGRSFLGVHYTLLHPLSVSKLRTRILLFLALGPFPLSCQPACCFHPFLSVSLHASALRLRLRRDWFRPSGLHPYVRTSVASGPSGHGSAESNSHPLLYSSRGGNRIIIVINRSRERREEERKSRPVAKKEATSRGTTSNRYCSSNAIPGMLLLLFLSASLTDAMQYKLETK